MNLSSMTSGDAADFATLVDGVFLRYQGRPDGHFDLVYISEGCLGIWGLSAAAILADEKRIWHMADPDTRQRLARAVSEAVAAGSVWSEEWVIRDAQGQTRWLKGKGQPLPGENGCTHWVAVVTDITESSRVQQIQDSTRINFRMLVDRLEDIAVHRFGADMRVSYWNQASERMYGYTEEEALGRDVLDLLIPLERRAYWRQVFDDILVSRQRSTPFEGFLHRKDGTPVEVRGTVVLLEHPDRPGEFVCLDYDMTPIRRQEDERASLEAQLRQSQKLEALGTLAGGVAHDFNNILAAILGNTRLALMDAQDQPEVVQSLEEILRAAHRAKDLVQRILSFSRRSPTIRRMVSMPSVVAESVELLRATAPKSLALEVDFHPDTPAVLADPSQLHQVFMNLCTNALQAIGTPDQGRMRISVAPHPGVPQPLIGPGALSIVTDQHGWPEVNVCVRVEDNGSGMDEVTMARLFEPFFTTKPMGEGTGLGLAVVHGILRDHQAAITVQSKPGSGSVFSVILRAADPELATDSPASEDTSAVSAGELADDGVPPILLDAQGRLCHILYVDDDELINDLVRRMLQRAGFPVTLYARSHQALDDVRAGKVHYDLAVVDYMMPSLNGLELARELRRLHPDRPVAITSGLISEELRRDAPLAGIDELIHKPNTGTELLQAISRLARKVVGQG
ncbi:PAS domain-containing sensor histidine kinase [uncultured Hydrogenophaga sp.]|uniref:PAS domain-containing sensor histidine kinase n=1 Tax=uncultured Hydrogenophaga sp. TaxID=199683 RepID=UPI00265FD7B9|nr:PAS domain-containing sensor histidine kinase [uncultured Hydrogenophaga sp.]